jgi:hypothetical protein
MSSTVDGRTLITVMASMATAICSAASLTVSNVGTSIANQVSADTGLTAVEKAILTTVSSAIQSTQPSSSIHNVF